MSGGGPGSALDGSGRPGWLLAWRRRALRCAPLGALLSGLVLAACGGPEADVAGESSAGAGESLASATGARPAAGASAVTGSGARPAAGEPVSTGAAAARGDASAGSSACGEGCSGTGSAAATAASAAASSAGGAGAADAGGAGEVAAPPPCPAEMQQIGRYCIDRYEAHLVTVDEAGAELKHPYFERPLEGVRYEARSSRGVFPQGYISRLESEQACRNAGKRLCTWLEWRRACQGKTWQRHPWGFQAVRGRCNNGKQHVLMQLFGSDDNLWKYEEHFNSPLLNLEPGFLARTGQHDSCKGEEDIYDMIGNLHEWVSGMVDEDFMERLEQDDVERRKQPWRVGNGIFLGGFFSNTRELGPGCFYTTVAHAPRYHDYSTGFRCCQDATRPAPKKPPRR